jgi:hypothetical protein
MAWALMFWKQPFLDKKLVSNAAFGDKLMFLFNVSTTVDKNISSNGAFSFIIFAI